MKELTASIYMDWGSPLRIFTGTIEPQAEQDSLDVPFFVSVRDFAVNVGSSTIKRWGSNAMPCPGSVRVNNAILTNKQEPHYHCTAVPFVELRKLTNNTDMHPQNKDRANAIIKWLEPIYKDYAEATLKPTETGNKTYSFKFGDTSAQVGFTVDDVAKRLYELKKENESLQAEVEKLKKELDDYRTIRDMFLSIGGD